MRKKAFLVEAAKCSGCNLCIIACKDEHVGTEHGPWAKPQPDTGHFWMRVDSMERGRIPRVHVSFLPLFCQHCANAACVKACPEGAIKTRDDGLVWIDAQVCKGCGLCRDACPYGVVYLNEELGIAQKCTGCAHRVDEGEPPRCVDICPHDAIVFGDDAVLDEVGEVYHPEYHARPRVRWNGLPRPWIAGTVVDAASDEVMAGASITVVDLFEDRSVTVRSDEFGDFRLTGLEAGRKYRVEIGRDGYDGFVAIATTSGDQDLGDVRLSRPSAPAPDHRAPGRRVQGR